MQELNKVLGKEKQSQEIVVKAKERSRVELAKIKKEFEADLELAKILTKEERDNLLSLRTQKKLSLEKEYQVKLQDEFLLLKKTSKRNFRKAVDCLSRFLLDSYA